MTEQNNEEPARNPFDFRDPSERVREIVNSGNDGHDPGDESDHQPVTAEGSSPNAEPEPAPLPVGMKALTDYLDEDLAGVVSSLVREIESLKAEKATASSAAKVEDLVNALGDEWQPVFRDKANRAKLNTAMKVMKAGYERSNLTVPDEQEILSKVLRSEFGEIKESIEQEAVNNKVAERKSQMIARASGRRTDSLTPKESAMKSVHQMMVERGLYST